MNLHECHAHPSFLTSHWFAFHEGSRFLLQLFIPFTLIVHNYVRIGRALFKSLKEREQLKEGRLVIISTCFESTTTQSYQMGAQIFDNK